jgi:hypothetical protein
MKLDGAWGGKNTGKWRASAVVGIQVLLRLSNVHGERPGRACPGRASVFAPEFACAKKRSTPPSGNAVKDFSSTKQGSSIEFVMLVRTSCRPSRECGASMSPSA